MTPEEIADAVYAAGRAGGAESAERLLPLVTRKQRVQVDYATGALARDLVERSLSSVGKVVDRVDESRRADARANIDALSALVEAMRAESERHTESLRSLCAVVGELVDGTIDRVRDVAQAAREARPEVRVEGARVEVPPAQVVVNVDVAPLVEVCARVAAAIERKPRKIRIDRDGSGDMTGISLEY